MKQIILEKQVPVGAEVVSVCGGRLVLVWGAYGLAMAGLWNLAGGDSLAQAAAWGVAIALGLGLWRFDRGAH